MVLYKVFTIQFFDLLEEAADMVGTYVSDIYCWIPNYSFIAWLVFCSL